MFGNNAPEVSVLRTVVQELAGKLAEMKVGLDSKAASYFVPMKVLPDLAIEYMRLTREFEIQSKLKAFLLPAFEQSKLDETKNSLAFVVLDRAVPPHKKSGPRRSIMLLVALLGSAVLTSLLVLGYVRVRQARGRFVDDQVRLGLKSR
jgi:tyrosine-protein kinase Etk/Wzc